MFASNSSVVESAASISAPEHERLSGVDVVTERARATERSDANPSATTYTPDDAGSWSWLTTTPPNVSIELHQRGDEPRLEYGCVDWFLY